MTLDEFLEKLTRRNIADWTISEDGRIRCEDGRTCPIYAAADLVGLEDPIGAAFTIDLPVTLADEIMEAADSRMEQHAALRSRILAAIGLEAA